MSQTIFLRLLQNLRSLRTLDLANSGVYLDFLTTNEMFLDRHILQFTSPLHTLDLHGNNISTFNSNIDPPGPPSTHWGRHVIETAILASMLDKNRHLHRIRGLNNNLPRNIQAAIDENATNYFQDNNSHLPENA